jgi:adenylate kinase family enzyme
MPKHLHATGGGRALRLRRMAVVGCSGSGKSALARRIAQVLGCVHVELDSIYHQPHWQPLAPAQFLATVEQRIAGDAWVVDGNYRAVQPAVWARAEAIVCLDLPKALVMRQIIVRTLKRGLLRTKLWNGNRERLRDLLHWDPERSIIRWAYTQHEKYVARYEQAMVAPQHAQLAFHRLRSHDEAARFVASLSTLV